MSAPFSHWLKSLAVTAPAAFAAAALLSAPAIGQNTAPPSNPPAAKDKGPAKDPKDTAKDTAKDVKDTAKDAAKDTKDAAKYTRDAAKDARDDAKDTTKNAPDAAKDTSKDARDAARDTQRDARDTVRDPRDPRNPARDQSRDARDPENLKDPNRDTRRDPRDDRDNRDARDRDGRDNRDRDSRDTRESRTEGQTSFRAESTRAADIGLWFERDTSKGLVISDVGTRGAIAKLGFREGDRIVSVNGQRITREADFISYLFADEVRTQRVKVIVIRDGREEVIIVEPNVFVEELSYVDNDPFESFGVIIDDRYDDRIVVWRVMPRSPAYYAGIRAGDVIISLGDQRIASVDAFKQYLTSVDAGEVQVRVNRGNAARTLHVDVPRFVARSERRTALRPNFENAAERRDDRLDRRDDRIDDRRDRRESIDATPAPRVPNVPVAPTPGVAPAPAPAPAPAITPTPAPRAAPSAAPGTGNPAPRPGLFPRNKQ